MISFDFSPQNIYAIRKIIGNKVSKINPSYFGSLCGTTGLFIFLIKDALEYAGITSEKKTQPTLIYNTLKYSIEKDKDYIEYLKAVQSR